MALKIAGKFERCHQDRRHDDHSLLFAMRTMQENLPA
jgi:hypothetical protein